MQADVARALKTCCDIELQLGEPAAAVDHYRQAFELRSQLDTHERFGAADVVSKQSSHSFGTARPAGEARHALESALRQFPKPRNTQPDAQATYACYI